MLKKLTSRKFLICLAALLASVATSIAGLNNDNETIATIGCVCSICSAGLYAVCEAMIDIKAINNDKEE